ncbi:MAG: heat-inducible transcriptional repressor HrcA [Candidatus Muproteobacteria bacterium RIFCSPHIGHO2_02_FULL_65_16]|uniref:Heat-inducible transcription repressor HrcA n=1 Tax=Candidatus Muproteobacteria bacterium RIFCSPHIGHO2_02_FULL_65_16 TaxID=1817766 RepID=A0A1F6U0T3_9PROT|nr:MAG: heat-inducible transcriptional repressor HrcA [Candidatus Muproteobacteria bacterium RIFCSPHIGHO2_02_FULL_65_16]
MMTLNARAEILLKTLIERYIADGQPVGSRTLARQAGLELSPATVRNVMADLEGLGLIAAPHTSAGRVPTQRGYRVFIDTLLKVRPLDSAEVRKLKHELRSNQDPKQLIEAASHILSDVSKLAGIVMVPRREEQVSFRHIDFLGLGARRVLVILVTHDGQVHNRLISTDREYSAAELVQAANYFNATYAGVDMTGVTQALVGDMQQASEDMQRIMRLAVEMAHQAFQPEREKGDDIVVSGEANLMDFPELGDIRTLRRLFDAFNAKRDLLHLLDRCMRTAGVKIFIGAESGYKALEECSVVTAPYSADGQVVGTLGVVGPTRMSYEHVIPVVDITAKLLSAALSGPEPARESLESRGG